MLMDQQDGGIIFANGYIEVEEGPHGLLALWTR
jgi:hypothetical protein